MSSAWVPTDPVDPSTTTSLTAAILHPPPTGTVNLVAVADRRADTRGMRALTDTQVRTATGVCSTIGGLSWAVACFVHNTLPQGCIDEGCADRSMRGSTTLDPVLFGLAGVLLAVSGIGLLVLAHQRGGLGRLGALAGLHRSTRAAAARRGRRDGHGRQRLERHAGTGDARHPPAGGGAGPRGRRGAAAPTSCRPGWAPSWSAPHCCSRSPTSRPRASSSGSRSGWSGWSSVSRCCATGPDRMTAHRPSPSGSDGDLCRVLGWPMNGGPSLPQQRNLVTEIPGPESLARLERKKAHVADGVGTMLPGVRGRGRRRRPRRRGRQLADRPRLGHRRGQRRQRRAVGGQPACRSRSRRSPTPAS